MRSILLTPVDSRAVQVTRYLLYSRALNSYKFTVVKPDGQSLIAAGSWCPGKNELATIRYVCRRICMAA